jgi:hypothetical protein
VKQLEAMRDADEPILFCTFDDPGYPEPQSIAILRDDLEDIGRGIGIMHFAYQGSDAKQFLENSGNGRVFSRRDEIEFGRASVWDEEGRPKSWNYTFAGRSGGNCWICSAVERPGRGYLES